MTWLLFYFLTIDLIKFNNVKNVFFFFFSLRRKCVTFNIYIYIYIYDMGTVLRVKFVSGMCQYILFGLSFQILHLSHVFIR